VPERPSRRFDLLRRNGPFALLFTATAGSALGTYLAALALSVDIFDRTGSGRWLAALLIADFLPMVVIGLTLGPLVDRLSRRRLMVVSDLVRGATFCLLPFVDEPGLIVALAAVNGIATGFFRPAVWAGLPNLVDEREREDATSLLSTVEHVAWMLGPVLAGVLLALPQLEVGGFDVPVGTDLAYWLNAGTFIVSAILVSRIPAVLLQSSESLSRGHWRDVRDGLGLVLSSRPLLTVLLVWSTAGIATASVNVAEVVLAKDELDSGNIGLGILVGATGVGLVVGSFFASAALGSLGMRVAYGGSLALMGVGFGLAALSPTIAVAAVLAGVAAVGNGCAIVCNQVLVQRGAPDEMRGRSLAVLMSVYYAVLGLGMAGAGLLTDVAGARAVWATAGVVYLVASLIALVMTRRIREEAMARIEADGGLPPDGIERIEALLGEIESTRRVERERPPKQLPYIPRRRAGSR
jgi:MFS family permease